MHFWRTEVRLQVVLNYSIVLILCVTELIITLINIIEQLAPRLQHFHTQPELGCNGHIELCNRSFSNITQIASHDSAFVGILPMDNQNLEITHQLDSGVRFLQAQTHLDGLGQLSLCHTDCGMKDSGTVQDFLVIITNWLNKHPQEVITLLLTNGDYTNLSHFSEAFTTSRASEHAYIPLPTHNASILSSWPTLGQLIASEKRLVVFLDSGASPSVPYLLNEFDYFWETPFDTTNPTFPQCTISRPGKLHAYPDVAAERMIIMNHFLDTEVLGMDLPDRRDARKTNAASGVGSLGAQAKLCGEVHGRAPVGLLVDYVDQGEGIRAQDMLNGF